jgi:hypothetical protein
MEKHQTIQLTLRNLQNEAMATEKKVVLDPEDFEKLVVYVSSIPVNFKYASKAVEIQEVIKKAQVMNLEMIEKKEK